MQLPTAIRSGSISWPQAVVGGFMCSALTAHCVMPCLQADPQTGFQQWMQQYGRSYSEEEQARLLHCLTPLLRYQGVVGSGMLTALLRIALTCCRPAAQCLCRTSSTQPDVLHAWRLALIA